MARPRPRQRHLREVRGMAAEARHRQARLYLRGKELALFVYITGSALTKAFFGFLALNIGVPCRAAFYKAYERIGKWFIRRAERSMKRARNTAKGDIAVGIDGQWNNARHGTHCYVTFVNQKSPQKEIIHTELVSKSNGNCKGNYKGPSNQMEVKGVKRGMKKLVAELKDRLVGYSHDRDNKTRVSLEKYNLTEKIDPNHLKKGLIREYNDLKPKIRGQRHPLLGVKDRLIRWFYILLKKPITPEERKELWRKSEEHFINNPDPKKRWAGGNNPENVNILRQYLRNTESAFDKAEAGFDTQKNESVNSARTHYAPKNMPYRNSAEARNAITVLSVNEPDMNWIPECARAFHIDPMAPDIRARFDSEVQMKLNAKAKKETEEDRKKHNARRNANRQSSAAPGSKNKGYGESWNFRSDSQPPPPPPSTGRTVRPQPQPFTRRHRIRLPRIGRNSPPIISQSQPVTVPLEDKAPEIPIMPRRSPRKVVPNQKTYFQYY